MVRTGARWRVLLAAAAVALVGIASPAGAQDDPASTTSSSAPSSTTTTAGPVDPVTGPIAADAGPKGRPVTAATESLAERGYEEREVLLSGRATLHGPRGVWGSDGRWRVTDLGEVPYTTRLLVRRPIDPATASGTVYVSWLNVNGAFDADPEWAQIGDEVVRQGATWVGVSAQALGVSGPLGAKAWDPQRYGAVDLTSEAASYDVFTQAAQAIRDPAGTDPLGGLPGERRLIAVGQSQSAQRLVTYANAFQPRTKAFDGFLLISRFRGAAPLGAVVLPSSQAVDPDGSQGRPFLPDPVAALLSGPTLAKIRTDLDVPVLTIVTETEAQQDRAAARPDGDRFRTWEVAGAAHADQTSTAALVAKLQRDFPQVPLGQLECADQNAFPLRYALRAAARAMAAWVQGGALPPTAPPLQRDQGGELVRDDDGNVRGGLRLPEIDVPTAKHTGVSSRVGYCGLAGATVPFTAERLVERYPTPEAYVAALTASIRKAIDAGYLLVDDAAQLLDVAPVPGSDATAAAIAATTGEPALTAPSGVAAPSTPTAGSAAADVEAKAAAGVRAQSWMATTGRDLITPFLGGLLLLLNGKVVLTIAQQRRRRGARSAPPS